MRYTLTAIALMFLFTSCTMSGVHKKIPIDITARDNSSITIYGTLEGLSSTQDTAAGDAPLSATPSVAFALKGAQGSAAQGGDIQLEGILNDLKQWMDERDQSTTEVAPTPAPSQLPAIPEAEIAVAPLVVYSTMGFHHTQSDPRGEKDGGKSLVLCPDEEMRFDEVYVLRNDSKVNIPWHRVVEDNRPSWWNMQQAPEGPIIGRKGNTLYSFPADDILTYGKCE